MTNLAQDEREIAKQVGQKLYAFFSLRLRCGAWPSLLSGCERVKVCSMY